VFPSALANLLSASECSRTWRKAFSLFEVNHETCEGYAEIKLISAAKLQLCVTVSNRRHMAAIDIAAQLPT